MGRGAKFPTAMLWHPYTISLRLINWLICLDYFGDALCRDIAFMEKLSKSMYRQYRHLLANQEKHLLANHYFRESENACRMRFALRGEMMSLTEGQSRDLLVQLDEQILPDGVHYERSMMYHKLALEELIARDACLSREWQASA